MLNNVQKFCDIDINKYSKTKFLPVSMDLFNDESLTPQTLKRRFWVAYDPENHLQ
jgi:hypothetical protein